jgi:D-sedoheptulose 7-phosphate isomerase
MKTEPTGFLYPFIDSEESDATTLVTDLAASARAKFALSRELRATTLERCGSQVAAAGAGMAERFRAGGRLMAFGNGGSATDADGAVELFRRPPTGRPLPAVSLVEDRAVLTALANDIGFESVFARQVIAYARTVDMAVGFSTSGDSVNVLRALEEAHRRGLLTIGLSGYEGGTMAASDAVDHTLIVRSDSVHRIQEAQDALMLELWTVVQGHLADADEEQP